MNTFSQHRITAIKARRFNYEDAPLIIELAQQDSLVPSEVILYLKDDGLTAALVKAINDAVEAHPMTVETAEAA